MYPVFSDKTEPVSTFDSVYSVKSKNVRILRSRADDSIVRVARISDGVTLKNVSSVRAGKRFIQTLGSGK